MGGFGHRRLLGGSWVEEEFMCAACGLSDSEEEASQRL